MASSTSSTSLASPSLTGQRALAEFPGKSSIMLSRTVHNYTVPDHLLIPSSEGSSTTAPPPWSSPSRGGGTSTSVDSFVGISVLKVNKAGKLQPRRLAITADKRNLVISSHKITSLKGLFSRLNLKKKRSSAGGGTSGGSNAAAGGGGAANSDASSSSASTKVISLEAIDRIQRGASTHKFVLARHEAQTTGNVIGGAEGGGSSSATVVLKLLNDASSSQPCCVSIIYYCSSNNGGNSSASSDTSLHLETLDLVVPDLTEYETLVTCLEDLHHLHCQERLRTSAHLQRLQAQWVLMGKAWHEPLKESEFLALCDRLQVPLKRAVLSIMFREELSSVSTSSANSNGSNNSSNVVSGGRVKARITVNSSSNSPAPKSGAASSGSHPLPADDRLGFAGVAALLETIAKTSTATQPVDHPAFEKLWQELLDTDPVPPVRLHSYPSQRAAGRPDGDDDGDEGNAASLELRIPGEESISALAFLGFLRSTQKEFSTSLEQATHIVQALNAQITVDDLVGSGPDAAAASGRTSAMPRVGTTASAVALHAPSQQDRLTKSQFMEYLTCDSNDLLQPSMGRSGHDDMTKPLSHYWIHTSHDTFLEPLSHSFVKSQYQQFAHPSANSTTTAPSANSSPLRSPSSHHHHGREWNVQEQPYMAALLRGVRCVEIDVWDGLDGKEPVVARAQPTSTSDRRISLAIILRTVAAFLDLYPHSYPVLLRLENHATSPVVLQRIAQLFTEILGAKIAKPSLDLQSLDSPSSAPLPSPESLRGKVVVIGKRPKRLTAGLKVCRDDYDADNDSYHMLEKTRELTTPTAKDGRMSSALDDYYFDNESSVVVGFTAKGPVRANKDDPGVSPLSPDQLLEATVLEYRRAQGAVEQLSDRVRERELAADEAESKAAHFTHLSGWTTDQVKDRALRLQQGGSSGLATRDIEEEKSPKDEGLEVHEVLPELVEGSRGRYEQAAREAMEGAGHEAQCHALLKEKEVALRMARENLSMARERESAVSENAKKARSEAIANQEHADVARERVLKVRDLLKNCKDQTSTAGTVVQTALTEAKISEKRAADAEARAARAQQAADADRKRAEEETKKEELLEQQVNDLHDDCMRATEATRDARERLEKAASMLERVNDQLKIIETSSQYRAEVQAKFSSESGPAVPRGGSFLVKHTAKLDEREMCRELIREASEEAASADAHRKELQRAFEDRAYQWRVQADLAAAARRTADRSLHVADELLEQAEEEREAANLRHTARQRAEATVENRGSHRSSLEAQLVEAERAAAEAANVSLQSKKRAEHLAREADKLKDHSRFQKVLEDLEWERDMAKQEYDAARADRERKDRAMADEKRRLDTNAAVCQEATREAAVDSDRTREEQHYQQEAVVAYSEALACRQEAGNALEQLNELRLKAESRRMAVDRAKEYKSRMDMMIELPLDLSRLTMFHSTKYLNWSRSMSLSKAEMHSFAHNVLLLMLDKNPDDERRNLHSFTKNHLCRVYPSWKALQNKNFTNYDPVFAWSLGCQMVSSNLHSADESLLVADGRFRQNGSCGYVLKPPYLLDNISKTESDQRWSLQVMSGHNLPRPSSRKVSGLASPLVKISVYSGSHKETRISYRTRPAKHVGLNPVWTTNNKFELTISIASVSMVSFSVWHVMDDGAEAFMGASALPASCLREGFRSVALFDEHHTRSGEYRNASLLVKTTRR